MPDVIVIGAGPVGLLIAGELAHRGVDVTVLERRPEAGAGTRAVGIHSPVLAALEVRGVTERLLAHAVRVTRGEARAAGRTLGVVRFDRLPARFPFVATLPQAATEAVLAADAPAVRRGARVRAVMPHRDRVGGGVIVRADADDGAFELEAPIVIVATGAGGRGLVFRGSPRAYRDRYLMTDTPPTGSAPTDEDTAVVNLDRSGVLESFPLPGGARRYVAWDAPGADPDPAAQLARLRRALQARGEFAAAAAATEATGFGVQRFVAPQLRRGGLIVIGDAAHEVSPIGGQGMNLGLLDAAALAPLVAQWVHTGVEPGEALAAWETHRVRSARRAAALAAVNTALGRPARAPADALRRAAVRIMLAGPSGRGFAHAYAMGLDASALRR
ncbi:MAG TPA: NAD(P)/FAD-dependent oxidoreductase [Microbacterium sp.]|nr:NAD(P)/FAD-dependent oxidoreductase [Microbacterium sp.]